MTQNQVQTIEYQTKGTCCRLIKIQLINDEIQNVEFIGGCQGNLTGISCLVKGAKINDLISKLSGITCGAKPTSCPDQLAQCLMMYQNQKLKTTSV